MLDDDDVRRVALSFPETPEKERWNHPTFDVAGKMSVTVSPHKFWTPQHEAAWVRVRLDARELRDILFDPRRQAAPSRLIELEDW